MATWFIKSECAKHKNKTFNGEGAPNTLDPLRPNTDQHVDSPHFFLYISFGVNKENLVNNEEPL